MLTPNLGKHSGVIRMEEAKKIFPGHALSHLLFLFSTFVLVGIISIFFGGGDVFDIANYLPRTEFFENDGKYLLVVALATIATLSYQHKAVFTKKTDDDKVYFWKQITPYFIYGRREFDVKDLSYWVKRREIKEYESDDTGHRRLTRKTTTNTVFLYEIKKKFFVIRPNIISYIRNDKPADYFRKILGKGPRRGHKEKDWFFDLIYYIID